MEQKYSASLDAVYNLLTDARWLEARCLALGELSAKIKVRKSAKGAAVTMTRRVKRELPALVAKVLPAESDLQFDESWAPDGEGYGGTIEMNIVGQPVKMAAQFSLAPAGKGCVYRIEHSTRCSIPLIGGTVAKFAQGQIEHGCAEEFAYLVKQLKAGR